MKEPPAGRGTRVGYRWAHQASHPLQMAGVPPLGVGAECEGKKVDSMKYKCVQMFSGCGLETDQLKIIQPTQVVCLGWLERFAGQDPMMSSKYPGVRGGQGAPSCRIHLRKVGETGGKAAFTFWSTLWETCRVGNPYAGQALQIPPSSSNCSTKGLSFWWHQPGPPSGAPSGTTSPAHKGVDCVAGILLRNISLWWLLQTWQLRVVSSF